MGREDPVTDPDASSSKCYVCAPPHSFFSLKWEGGCFCRATMTRRHILKIAPLLHCAFEDILTSEKRRSEWEGCLQRRDTHKPNQFGKHPGLVPKA